jgi:acetoin utilization protein AcuB
VKVDLGSTVVRDCIVASPVITRRTTVATALKLLRETGVPALPVWEDGHLAGLVDEKALLRLTPSEATTLDVYELREVLDKMTVGRLVAPACAEVTPDMPLDQAAVLMLGNAVEVLPVLDTGRLVGLLTRTSLLRAAVGSTALRSRSLIVS